MTLAWYGAAVLCWLAGMVLLALPDTPHLLAAGPLACMVICFVVLMHAVARDDE